MRAKVIEDIESLWAPRLVIFSVDKCNLSTNKRSGPAMAQNDYNLSLSDRRVQSPAVRVGWVRREGACKDCRPMVELGLCLAWLDPIFTDLIEADGLEDRGGERTNTARWEGAAHGIP